MKKLIALIDTVAVLFKHCVEDFLPGFIRIHCDHIIGNVVHCVHGAGADVQNNIISVQFVLL